MVSINLLGWGLMNPLICKNFIQDQGELLEKLRIEPTTSDLHGEELNHYVKAVCVQLVHWTLVKTFLLQAVPDLVAVQVKYCSSGNFHMTFISQFSILDLFMRSGARNHGN